MPRLIRRYRRSLAFLLAFLGVLIGLSSIRERPQTWDGIVITKDLPAGHSLTPADLSRTALSTDLRPGGALASPEEAAGRVLAGPVTAGELLVEQRLVGPSLLAGSPPGHVATPIRLEDPAEASFLSPGDVVDVLAARRASGFSDEDAVAARVVASSVRVLALPGQSTGDIGGFLGSAPTDTGSGGSVVVVGTDPAGAAAVAGAAATSRLSLLVRSDAYGPTTPPR